MAMTGQRNRWAAIPQLPQAHYEVDTAWGRIEWSLMNFAGGMRLDLDPDYQRMHVWSEDQQVAYVAYILQGGEVGKNITWNCRDWERPAPDDAIELVDGKQRLEAVRRFIRGDLEVFGMRYREADTLRIHHARFKFRVCSLSRADVLRLYLNINAGGTPHTAEEIDRVRGLLDAEAGR